MNLWPAAEDAASMYDNIKQFARNSRTFRPSDMRHMFARVHNHAISPRLAPEKLLEIVQKLGFASVEAFGDKIGLERSTVSVMVQGKHPLAADAATRNAARDWAKWVVDCNAALGAPILGGPMHSELGFFTGSGPTPAERKRRVQDVLDFFGPDAVDKATKISAKLRQNQAT